jgi:hypothetical protein
MKRTTLNFWVDTLALIVLLGMIETGLILKYLLPPGSGGRHGGEGTGLTLWGMGRHDWGEVHWWLSVALIVLMIVHVWLHWDWVHLIGGGLFGLRRSTEDGANAGGSRVALSGTVFALVVIVLLGGLFVLSHQAVAGRDRWSPEGEGRRHRGGRVMTPDTTAPAAPSGELSHDATETRHGNERIRGRTTLNEAAEMLDVEPSVILAELGLPDETDPNTQLSHLARETNVTVSVLRDRLGSLRER